MQTIRSAIILGALALVPAPTTPRHNVAENIHVGDFASSLTYSLSSTPIIRRGVTSRVSITKHLIDLVPFQMVSVSGQNATISNLSNGQNGGVGFIAMDVTVPGGATLGGQITLNVGLTDHFPLRVVNRGVVSSVTKVPDPSTLQAGAQWVATVIGTDLGTPVVDAPAAACHTIVASNRTNTSVQFTLQRAATCGTSSYNFRLKGSAANDPPSWASTSGTSSNFGFAYLPTGGICTSAPNIGTPVITSPSDGQVFVFAAATPTPVSRTITWQLNTQPNNVPAPNNEWIVSRSGTGIKGSPSTTVVGTSKTFNFTLPGTYTVTIKAANCGQSAPSSSITFSTQRQ